MHIVGQKDKSLLPHNTSFFITHVVDLIKHYPAHLTHYFRSSV
jgi:hypothetical protein